MRQKSYLNFDLKIERKGKNFNVQVLSSPFGEASGTFTMPFTEDKLELLLLKVGSRRKGVRGINNPELKAASEIGGKLFDAVFDSRIGECFNRSLDKATQDKMGLRLRLRLQNVPELASLPWEFLFESSSEKFFAISNQTPIIRYIEMTGGIPPLEVKLPLEILVMIASPSDLEKLDVNQEKSRLQEALHLLSKEEMVKVDWLEEATLPALQKRLNEREFHIFHFIGHGVFDQAKNEGLLALEDEYGRSSLTGARRIGTLLHDHRSLRLAVLNSCEGARNSLTDPFSGVATHLIRQGIPSVIAMQFEISDQSALVFASQFYSALAGGFPVDAAVSEARKAIHNLPNDLEWGTPVLYMRSTDGVLFNLTQTPIVKNVRSEGHQDPPISVEEKPAETREASTVMSSQPQINALPQPRITYHFKKPTVGQVIYNDHKIDINDTGWALEVIKYDGKEVSRKYSGSGAHHVFRVFEDGADVQYIVSLSNTLPKCEVSRNGIIIYSDNPPQAKDAKSAQEAGSHVDSSGFGQQGTVIYGSHSIGINDTGSGLEIVTYDGSEISRKFSFLGAHHIFRVVEDGAEVQYIVSFSRGSKGCEVTRNGEIIFTNL